MSVDGYRGRRFELRLHQYVVSLCLTLLDGVSPFESIPSLSIDACGVLSQLRRINPNKAHGPDELSPQLLKLVAEEHAQALPIIFLQSYDQSSTPRTGIRNWYAHLHESLKISSI